MEITYLFLQHYWWFVISLLAGLLVFLLFVQGGQTMLGLLGKDEAEKSLLINSLGHKWEFTFTTLVTFGGAFFASFPLFYSTSFGGAFYVWMAILFVFVIQAVAYEFRSKPNNLLGAKTYETFLLINGLLGTILIGTAVGTFFTGSPFIVDRANIGNFSGANVISTWATAWRGLDALADYRNIALGLAVFFLARVLAIHYFYNNIDTPTIREKGKKPLLISSALFLVCFLTFLISILCMTGQNVDFATGALSMMPFKYLHNLLDLPLLLCLLLLGIVSVLWGLWIGFKGSSNAIWFSGIGTVVTVTMLLLTAGYNNSTYYPSSVDPASSLTIVNSSSSYFTLQAMSIVSLIIPFVVAYIWYAWRAMNKKKQ